jgi:serine/threonine protein kinase/TolB-like protein/Flp pilus assembly protein TadD
MIRVIRICRKCGAKIFADAPEGLCAACVLKMALGNFPAAPVAAGDGGGSAENIEPNAAAPSHNKKAARAVELLGELGDYELLEEIGRGGQGVVFRARQKSLNRIVALKVISLGQWASKAHLRRFRLEAEAAARLEHPGIVPIHEVGERDGSCYFSMKFVEGGQLDEVVRSATADSSGGERAPISIRQAAELIAKVARTVHYAHEHGILHRDIKPGNILLDQKGEPHLTDFGLARLVETESTMTRTLDVLGTPSYMAPEQAMGNNAAVGSVTDIYGLGAVLYQLLTGHPPFAGGATYETIKLLLDTEPRQPRLLNPKIDRDLSTICLKCLEKAPEKRYASASELAEDLERWLRQEPIHARPVNVFTRTCKWIRRNPVFATAIPITAALMTALSVILWQNLSREEAGRAGAIPPAGIAVLPFENLGDEKENASFVDGIQDDILTKLAKVADLKVISRTSVMQYRGARNTREIGRALRVSHVLEGSVRKYGDKIHLNAQLINTRDDTHVWAEEYDRDLTDVFAIQSELAQRIASQLSAKITHAEKAAIEAKPTNDREAYELYVRAKPLARLTDPDDTTALERIARAVELLEKAVARDPNFMLAYCLLTEANLSLYWVPGRTEPVFRARAEIALGNALRIAPEAGETHLAQALFDFYGNRDVDHALEELDIAARLLPNNADVFSISARIERRLNRWKEALRHFAKAAELDPREPTHPTAIATTYQLLRHYREAEETADRAIGMFPEAADQFWKERGEAALAEGDLEKARAAIEKLSNKEAFPLLLARLLLYEHNYTEAERVAVAPCKDEGSVRFTALGAIKAAPLGAIMAARAQNDAEKIRAYAVKARRANEPLLNGPSVDPSVLSDVGVIDAALGRREDAIAECRRAVELRPLGRDAIEGADYVASLALAYAWLGERDRAIEQLSSIINVPNGPSFGDLKLNPMWDDLRGDPRFEQLIGEAAKPIPLN